MMHKYISYRLAPQNDNALLYYSIKSALSDKGVVILKHAAQVCAKIKIDVYMFV